MTIMVGLSHLRRAKRSFECCVLTRDEPEQTPIGQVTADFFPMSVAEGVSQLQLAANDFRRRYPELLGPQGSFGVERYQDVIRN